MARSSTDAGLSLIDTAFLGFGKTVAALDWHVWSADVRLARKWSKQFFFQNTTCLYY